MQLLYASCKMLSQGRRQILIYLQRNLGISSEACDPLGIRTIDRRWGDLVESSRGFLISWRCCYPEGVPRGFLMELSAVRILQAALFLTTCWNIDQRD